MMAPLTRAAGGRRLRSDKADLSEHPECQIAQLRLSLGNLPALRGAGAPGKREPGGRHRVSRRRYASNPRTGRVIAVLIPRGIPHMPEANGRMTPKPPERAKRPPPSPTTLQHCGTSGRVKGQLRYSGQRGKIPSPATGRPGLLYSPPSAR